MTEEEEKLKSSSLIRCLTYNGCDDDDEDELNNKENVIQIKAETLEIKNEGLNKVAVDDSMIDHDYLSDASLSPQNTDVTTSDDSVAVTEQGADENKLTFKDKNELMDYITQNLSIDELLEKLTQAEESSLKKKELVAKVVQSVGFKGLLNEVFPVAGTAGFTTEQNNHITAMLEEMSKLMESNRSVKHQAFEVLSQKHSQDLLDHVVQENSASVICECRELSDPQSEPQPSRRTHGRSHEHGLDSQVDREHPRRQHVYRHPTRRISRADENAVHERAQNGNLRHRARLLAETLGESLER